MTKIPGNNAGDDRMIHNSAQWDILTLDPSRSALSLCSFQFLQSRCTFGQASTP